MQALLDTGSAKRGYEKQRLAYGITKLKAQLAAYKAAIKPIQKPSSLTNTKQQALSLIGTTGCSGQDSVTIKKPVLKIRDHSPWIIWPYLPGKTKVGRSGYQPIRNFDIQLTDGLGNPIPGKQIKIFTEYKETSGGHQHNYGIVQLDQNKQGFFYGQGQVKQNPIILITNQKGIAKIDSFIASQISGAYVITAALDSDITVYDTVQLQVRVPSLVNFRNLIFLDTRPYTFAQSDTGAANHPDNNWCTAEMGDSLYLSIIDFYFWTISDKNNGGKAIQTSINDMSLPWGGYFDLKANFDIDAEKPSHLYHRVGLSVDINNRDKRMNKDQLEELTNIMLSHHGKRYPETPIHYGFNGGY